MCRLLGYLGEHPLLMNALLDHYENSLVIQSKRAQETQTGINADGFGLGWFEHTLDPFPALFKSIQPAWNDLNLTSIASKVRSKCFIGHVRASTVGDVSRANCHPFAFGPLLCAHNGTVKEFARIKRPLLNLLDDTAFHSLKGTTDSEHLFALISTYLSHEKQATIETFITVIRKAIYALHDLQKLHATTLTIRANLLISDGTQMIALRYSSDTSSPPLSLYYVPIRLEKESRHLQFLESTEQANGYVVSSEHLTEMAKWHEVPPNSFLCIEPEYKTTIIKF